MLGGEGRGGYEAGEGRQNQMRDEYVVRPLLDMAA